MAAYYFVCVLFISAAWAAPVTAGGRITLDVVANDKSGRPVPGLQQQDFTVLDNKQSQKIVSFEAKNGLESGEITLVVDSVNTSFSRVGYERGQIKKFLQRDGGRLAQPMSIAFFSDAGIKLQQNATSDGNALITELNQNETALRSIRRSEGYYGAAERSQLSLRAVNELIAYEATKPGKKIVIWISPGWPLLSGPNIQLSAKDEQGIFNTVVATSTQLREAGIVLYAVNPLGADAGLAQENYYQGFLKGVRNQKQVQFGDLGLQVLSDHSGGRILNANNDLSSEIETCVRDAGAYYILAFDGVPADGPNEYHAIEVKIAQPGLKAQTLTGYYAQPTPRPTR